MDFLAVVGVEVDALLGPADRDGDLAAGVDAGVRQGDAVPDGRGDEVLPVDDPGQEELLVVDDLLLGQDVQELFDGLDLVLAFEIEYDLRGFEVIREIRASRSRFILHYRRSLAHSVEKAKSQFSRLNELVGTNRGRASRSWRRAMIPRAQPTIWSAPRRSQSGWISSVTLWYFVLR